MLQLVALVVVIHCSFFAGFNHAKNQCTYFLSLCVGIFLEVFHLCGYTTSFFIMVSKIFLMLPSFSYQDLVWVLLHLIKTSCFYNLLILWTYLQLMSIFWWIERHHYVWSIVCSWKPFLFRGKCNFYPRYKHLSQI